MNIFEFDDYRIYLRKHIQSLPKKGRGELSRIAELIGVNTTWISQIMSGAQNFNFEQALSLSHYLSLTELETDYLIHLVQIDRAGHHLSKKYLQKKIANIKKQSLQLSNRTTFEKSLNDAERAVFYSSWIYSATQLFCSLSEDGKSLEEIIEKFDLPRPRMIEIVNFLTKSQLIVSKNDKFVPGVQSTFLESGSPYLIKHHANWRIKAIQKSETISENELMFTSSVSLSKKDYEKLREELVSYIKNFLEKVHKSPAENLAHLNIDWFWIDR